MCDEISRLKTLVRKIDNGKDNPAWKWLENFNPSQALIVCLGAGPWKIARRSFIQSQALNILGKRDLSELLSIEELKFPLKWQNDKGQFIIDYLRRYKLTMEQFTTFLKNLKNPRELLYEITQTKHRAKVLDLFLRDYLQVPSFPIDRWVKRVLQEYNLPINEEQMIKLCEDAGFDSIRVARLIVDSSGFSGNEQLKTS